MASWLGDSLPRLGAVPTAKLTGAQAAMVGLPGFGAEGVIAKPFDPMTLDAQLRRILAPDDPDL